MAFTPVSVVPSTNPLVTVSFSGLMVVQPSPTTPNICEIGVHHFDRGHLFQVILIVNKTINNLRRPPILVPILNGPLTGAFEIGLIVDPPPPQPPPDPNPDFVVFAKAGFDRTTANSHELDHQWGINFKLKHDVRINDGAKPVVKLRTGVLYAPTLTNPRLNPRITRPQTADDILNQIAPSLAVSIDPPQGTRVQFKGRDQGDLLDLRLPREGDDRNNTTYTLAFMNEPPSLLSEPHDEFALYYKVFEDSNGNSIPNPNRFRLEFTTGTRSDEIPCMPVLLNP